MSHELRTPLNAVIGFSDVLLERMFGDLTERQEAYVRDIRNSGHHLLELINEILDLSTEAHVLGQLGRDQLQRHGPLERQVDGRVDDAHAPAAEHPLDAVAGDGADAGSDTAQL